VAKFDEGDDVRLIKKISFNTTHLRPNTRGEIKKIVKKKAFGGSEYAVRFRGVNFDIIVPEKSLDELSQGEG
jgi:hypothetical protein